MGTEKRDRQRANRQLKQIELAKQEQRRRMTRRGVIGGIIAVGGLALVIGIAALGGAFSGDDGDDVATPSDTVDPSGSLAPTSSVPFAYGTGECPPAEGTDEQIREFAEYPPECIDPAKTYTAEVVTSKGDLTVELFADQAPIAVNSFVTLARSHYFDDISCHRIIPGFVAQCGDPTGTGSGGPGYTFPDELPQGGAYQIGSLAMANSGPNTNGSQFFIITGEEGVQLPPSYTLFGMVTEGLDSTVPALDAVGTPGAGTPTEDVTIESVTITES